MPKSDTWPGGTRLDSMPGTDSSGSCDSVLSANSGFSDDSLEYLSAEEKACLMFLEETIDSLDTEDDSGLSNDEPEQKPGPGNVATIQAELSASMSRSTTNNEQKETTKLPVKKDTDKNPLPSYLVPTPFVVANSSRLSADATKPSVISKKIPCPKPTFSSQNNEVRPQLHQNDEPPLVPIEVNVVISPSTKTQNNISKAADRGPLSYDALVYLRKSASAKKTPLCPNVDHTIDSSAAAVDNRLVQNNLSRFDRSHPEFSQSRTIPPAVPPKPKKKSDNSSAMTQNNVTVGSTPSFSVKRTPNPEVVRQEALQKLGLIKVTNEPPSNPKVQNGLDPASSRYVKAQTSNNNPTRSPSFCVTRLPAEPKSRGLQSSASFHHSSRHGQPNASNPIQSNRVRTEHPVPPSSHHLVSTEAVVKSSATAVSQKPSNSVGYTVMVVPGMGADRREALRKLGLLKD